MGELRVRSALVTGANRGIGLGFVRHLLALPNPPEWVFAGCRDPKGQRAQVSKLALKHPNLVMQVTDPASIKAAAASVGERLKGSGLNLLINNAGIVRANKLDNETLKDMSEVYMTNTIAPLLLSQAFLPLLKKAAQGSPGSGLSCNKAAIVNISSNGGSIKEVYLWEGIQAACYRCSKVCAVFETKCQSMGYRETRHLHCSFHPSDGCKTDLGYEGGGTPPLTVDASVGGMLKVLSNLSDKDSALPGPGKGTLWPVFAWSVPPGFAHKPILS
uniref:Estradiol 17-beta-dehydrogenase 2-like n=1 Tax=Coturnix japonica TaxID=93934 RepID=A0A8C2TKW5_COTJA